MKCPLCGYEGAMGESACQGCPLARNCNKTRCCNCGYEFIPESSLSKIIKKLYGFWKRKKEGERNGSHN